MREIHELSEHIYTEAFAQFFSEFSETLNCSVVLDKCLSGARFEDYGCQIIEKFESVSDANIAYSINNLVEMQMELMNKFESLFFV